MTFFMHLILIWKFCPNCLSLTGQTQTMMTLEMRDVLYYYYFDISCSLQRESYYGCILAGSPKLVIK